MPIASFKSIISTMNSRQMLSFTAQLEKLSLGSLPARPLTTPGLLLNKSTFYNKTSPKLSSRSFTSTAAKNGTWLLPTRPESRRSPKGRPHVPTGGSARGTTVVWGDYGLRLKDHHRRISATQLRIGEEAIKKRLRGMKYRLYKRICANVGVYSSGNEIRMGKGKGSFDYWAARVAVSRVIFEIKGDVHEQIARDAFRLAGNKMPGLYEFVKKGDPAVIGITKLDGLTIEELKRPRRKIPLGSMPLQTTADTLPTVSASNSPEA